MRKGGMELTSSASSWAFGVRADSSSTNHSSPAVPYRLIPPFPLSRCSIYFLHTTISQYSLLSFIILPHSLLLCWVNDHFRSRDGWGVGTSSVGTSRHWGRLVIWRKEPTHLCPCGSLSPSIHPFSHHRKKRGKTGGDPLLSYHIGV
jgi:hypothetical protein